MTEDTPIPGFAELGLPESLLKTLAALGYEAPSPIQAATIPALLGGGDVLGQAQTGTGKTAAFALPILARLSAGDRDRSGPAALVLAPTRELAIQVAEAFQRYAEGLPGFHVLPIYGGQAYAPQLAGLRRGADVVVGTPGRIIDHLDKGTLKLDALQTLVLDEADEMLRMGFIDEVGQVLEKVPADCQKALFSATMPDPIRRIADRHLTDAEHITIRAATTTATQIHQRYWVVGGVHKLDALTRILEVEEFDAMIVFARTRVATEELALRLEARGFASAALHGEVPQNMREKIVDRLKRGDIDILVATDVAARGLDVERISHVVNYDIPYDTEAYVHRIGRTGRAGRSGEAILFVAPRERGMLRAIERATRQPIEPMTLPTAGDVNQQRLKRFRNRIEAALADEALAEGRALVQQNLEALEVPLEDLAAALVLMARGDAPLLLDERAPPPAPAGFAPDRPHGRERSPRLRDEGRPPREASRGPDPDAEFVRYRIEVGAVHGVRPGNIMGAIANEANLAARQIGRIRIHDECSHVELPAGMASEVIEHLQQVWVAGRQLQIREAGDEELPPRRGDFERRPPHRGRPERGFEGRPGRGEGRRPEGRFERGSERGSERKPERGPRPGGKRPPRDRAGDWAGDAGGPSRGPSGERPARAGKPRPWSDEAPAGRSDRERRPSGPRSEFKSGSRSKPDTGFEGKPKPGPKAKSGPKSGPRPGPRSKPQASGDAKPPRRSDGPPPARGDEGGQRPPKRPSLKRPPRTRAERKALLAGRDAPERKSPGVKKAGVKKPGDKKR